MNSDPSSAPLEASRHHPFWVCLLVFAALATDAGFRLTKTLDQREQLGRTKASQAAILNRLSAALAQLPQFESKLQAISVDLIQLGRTNAVAAQLIREFNINWTPGAETNTVSPSVSATNPPK